MNKQQDIKLFDFRGTRGEIIRDMQTMNREQLNKKYQGNRTYKQLLKGLGMFQGTGRKQC